MLRSPTYSRVWIISPAADLMLFVATPLAIVPLVAWLAHSWATPEQIALVVFAFASLGHHVPGLLRAYGDADLFAQYKWRFLLAPPLVLGVCLLFFVGLQLHGLELVLLLWATWHLMMQTYGFMRIYDAKLGRVAPAFARRDFAACLVVFAAGILFSDTRVYGLAEVAWLTGLPPFGPQWLRGARIIFGIAACGALLWWAAGLFAERKENSGINWLKLALLICTGILYWATGRLAVNLLVGVAMFEVFHAVQYSAVVWAYNRRRAEKDQKWLGPIGAMFRSRAGIAAYLSLIAAFGALAFLKRGEGALLGSNIAMALFSTSAMLHFYYDGFIWKVRQKTTRENLNIAGDDSPAMVASWRTSGLVHVGKWGLLAAGLLLLGCLEVIHAPGSSSEDPLKLNRLAALTPRVPELQTRLSQQFLLLGNTAAARQAAEKAVEMRPRSYAAHLALGEALAEAGKWNAADAEFTAANALRPDNPQILISWGSMKARQGDFTAAIRLYQQVLKLNPSLLKVRRSLVSALILKLRHGEAAEVAQVGVNAEPESAIALLSLGRALSAAQRYEEAAEVLRKLTKLNPDSSAALYQLGLVQVQLKEYEMGTASLVRCLELNPRHVQALYQLGAVQYLQGDSAAAIGSFQQCVEHDPQFYEAHNSLGASYFQRGQWTEAADAYRNAIEIRKEDASAHYNLGLALLFQGERAEARRRILQAAKLGHSPTPEVAAALEL